MEKGSAVADGSEGCITNSFLSPQRFFCLAFLVKHVYSCKLSCYARYSLRCFLFILFVIRGLVFCCVLCLPRIGSIPDVIVVRYIATIQ